MRTWSITRFGAELDGIELLDGPEPGAPGPGAAVVAIRASGISISDLLLATGGMPGMDRRLPYPIGIEYAGVVAAVGPDVEEVAVGDRVVGMIHDGSGSAAERITVPARDLGRLPEGLSFAEGAAIPVAYMTAHVVLHRQGPVRRGDRVLVTAAASGTGLAIVQLAAATGAEVYGAVSGSAKLDAVRAAGAVAAVRPHRRRLGAGAARARPRDRHDRRRQHPAQLRAARARRAARRARRDEPPSSPGETDYREEPGDIRLDPVRDLMFTAKTVTGIFVPLLLAARGRAGPDAARGARALRRPAIRPVIAATYSFEDAVEALRHLQQRRNMGRVVLEV